MALEQAYGWPSDSGFFLMYRVHYDDVIMTTIVSQITSLAFVYSTVYSDADQRKHQSSASLAFVWGIHRDRWIPRTKGQLRGKCFHLMTSSCKNDLHQTTSKQNKILIHRNFFQICCNAVALNTTPKETVDHDDVIKWKHFPRYWPFVRGIHRSPVNSPHRDQWRGALTFSLICDWINGWVNNREAGDLRRCHAHYDVIVMKDYNVHSCNSHSQRQWRAYQAWNLRWLTVVYTVYMVLSRIMHLLLFSNDRSTHIRRTNTYVYCLKWLFCLDVIIT